MNMKTPIAVALMMALLSACGATDESSVSEAEATSASSEAMVASDSEPIETPAESPPNLEKSDSTVTAGETETLVSASETATAPSGKKPKGKFMSNYDEKRKKRFIPKCEREMAQDLKPDQVAEACNCLFDELANTLDGIKERLNPPADKLEAANEKCLTKYL